MGKGIIIVHVVLKTMHIVTWGNDHIATGLREGRMMNTLYLFSKDSFEKRV